MSAAIELQRGDITKLDVDAIVTAANAQLMGGGGVDGAVHRAAGPELLRMCREIGGCPTGEARITPGFKLKARWVIHAVGPVWNGGAYNERKLLASAYTKSLALAAEKELTSIAFPAISCGVYGFPIPKACAIAKSAIEEWTSVNSRIERIVLVAFDTTVVEAFEALGLHVAT